ncbi:hypothetical protein [Nocardia gipuzkoensis]|uniref:hypothetical protein n=1 Tax=Nocardia gipuzkoensis TaxID=2749991 RepID=UPI00237EBCAA|nr:hypothetical protein [Nocardia gipuzkoensis]MDE1674242.1 hypothetical protein [Nocardia gipuzkoensis]
MPGNAALIAALVVLVPAFLGLYAVIGSPVGAALVAIGAAVLTALAGQWVSALTLRRRLVRRVAETNQRVATLAARVADTETRAALLRACDIVPRLIDRTETVDPASVPMTARKLLDYLASVESALRRYVEIQDHRSSFRDAEALLSRSRRVLAGFETFAAHGAEQVGDANLESFFRDLAHLELMNPPQLPPTEEL